MSRGLDQAQIAASTAPTRCVVQLVEMFFRSGVLRLARNQWSIPHEGNIYVGVAMNIRQLRESSGSIEGAEFSMTGIDPAIMAIVDQEQYRGRVVTLKKAYINPDTNLLIGEPKLAFIGRIKAMPSQETNSACDITVIAEHYDAAISRPAPTRLNDADHQRFYPGDLGCQHAEAMVEKNLVWPSREALQQ